MKPHHSPDSPQLAAFVFGLAGLIALAAWLAAGCEARGAEPLPLEPVQLVVINGTPRTLVLDVCCEGYVYGQPQVVPPGEAAAWAWRVGATTVTSYEAAPRKPRIWGPRLTAVKKGRALWVRLIDGGAP